MVEYLRVWEERWHPLREEWVMVAAHRQNRPWIGEVVAESASQIPSYVPDCYLCPGNKRVSGKTNDPYTSTFVFDNDHPCVGPLAPLDLPKPAGIYRNRPANGMARVVCYSPRHNLTLAELSVAEIASLLRVWQDQYRELAARPEVKNVLIFENKGEVVGVSNPHPHCQIYATNFVFKVFGTEESAMTRHRAETGRGLFEDIIASELEDGRRVIASHGSAIAFLPYFARYAYEVYVAPRARHPSLAALSAGEITDLAATLREALIRYDNLWKMSFPYVMVLHQAPTDGADHSDYHFHIQIHPPLRKRNLLKYLAGPEIGGGNFLSDTLPEDKAAELLAVPAVHFRQATRGAEG
jgi:UDPglucose--hexose-1-phosphate uridylyltransferase